MHELCLYYRFVPFHQLLVVEVVVVVAQEYTDEDSLKAAVEVAEQTSAVMNTSGKGVALKHAALVP